MALVTFEMEAGHGQPPSSYDEASLPPSAEDILHRHPRKDIEDVDTDDEWGEDWPAGTDSTGGTRGNSDDEWSGSGWWSSGSSSWDSSWSSYGWDSSWRSVEAWKSGDAEAIACEQAERELLAEFGGNEASDDEEEEYEPPIGSHEEELWSVLQQKFIKANSTLGVAFRREMQNTPEYKIADATPGTAALKELRRQWVEKKWMTEKTTRTMTEEHEECDFSKAVYESFDAIVTHEGGAHNKLNVEAAKNYCRWCIKKKGKWTRISKRTRRMEYAYTKEGFKDSMKKKWAITRTAEEAPPPVGNAGAEADAAKAKLDLAAAKDKARPKAKAGAKGKAAPKVKTPFEIAHAAAEAKSKAAAKQKEDANQMLEDLDDGDWKTFKIEYGPKIEAGLAELKAVMTPFMKNLRMLDMKGLKKLYGEAQCVVDCTAMVAALEGALEALQTVCSECKTLHDERLKFRNTACTPQPARKKARSGNP